MVRMLTVEGIGTFQLLIFRGGCQGLGCCLSLWAKGMALGSWLGTTRLERTALLLRAVVGYGGICALEKAAVSCPLTDLDIETLRSCLEILGGASKLRGGVMGVLVAYSLCL